MSRAPRTAGAGIARCAARPLAGASVLAAACTLALPASAHAATAGSATAGSADADDGQPLHVTRIAYGAKLHHTFKPNGKGAPRTASLTSPDDIAELLATAAPSSGFGAAPLGFLYAP
jgi:hypothetical protein